jgi:hypothetical protein
MQDAKITITRTTSNQHDEDFISIYIHVGKERHRVEMSLKDYGLAVSGMSRVPCQYDASTIGG